MPATQTFAFDGTTCTIKRNNVGFIVTIIEGGFELDICSKDGLDLFAKAEEMLNDTRKETDSTLLYPTPYIKSVRAAKLWKCDRIAYVASLASRKIAQAA